MLFRSVAAERLVLTAQAEKKAAINDLQLGDAKNASARLKGTAENLRRRASEISGSDDRTLESIQIIRTEADEIEQLANYAEHEDANYAVKRNMESMTRGTRSRKLRNQPTETSTDTDELN